MTSIDWSKTLTSKTVWLGILTVAIGIIEFLAGVPAGASAATIIVGVLGVIIRFLTNEPIVKG